MSTAPTNTASVRDAAAYDYATQGSSEVTVFTDGAELEAFKAGWDDGQEYAAKLFVETTKAALDARDEEVKRLTEQNERLRDMAELETVKKLRDENKRLREALGNVQAELTCPMGEPTHQRIWDLCAAALKATTGRNGT